MPLLHEPNKPVDDFQLTPDYDAVLAEWFNLHTDQPGGPYFTPEECRAFTFHWPINPPQTRAANGRFTKKNGD